MNCTPIVRQYNILKTTGVLFMPKGKPNKRYPAEFKQRVIEDMRENGLSYKETRRKYDSLNRDFEAEKPNQKRVTDVTEFSLFGQNLYLSPILDLCSRDIVSYLISDRPALSMVTQTPNTAFMKISDGTNLILHSDQGWHTSAINIKEYSEKIICIPLAIIVFVQNHFFTILKGVTTKPLHNVVYRCKRKPRHGIRTAIIDCDSAGCFIAESRTGKNDVRNISNAFIDFLRRK